MTKLTRDEWLKRAAARFNYIGFLNMDEALTEAEIYLDDILDGDTDEDPETSADNAMDDWN